MFDYTYSYKERLLITEEWSEHWDLFISAYNSSERVRTVFDKVRAHEKHWLLHPEYGYKEHEHPTGGRVFAPDSMDEADFMAEYTTVAGLDRMPGSVCIDSTGFMRHHLMFLMRWLYEQGTHSYDVLYTDPVRYVREENTVFTEGPVIAVRQIAGYEGQHIPDSGVNDLLLIGVGYDHDLIRRVAENKASARKVQLFGLPSLMPDMYQESVLRASRASEAIGPGAEHNLLFAPANDPFATAQVIRDYVNRHRERGAVTNLYLCPVGTKAQTVGFAFYYLSECVGEPVSMIFPFAGRYARETTQGVARVWKYSIEYPSTSSR